MPHIIQEAELSSAIPRPLCVDLCGTLVKSDVLIDSLLVLLRQRPPLLLRLPILLFQGKTAFKAYIAESVCLDVAHLPYNHELLRFLQQEKAHGRPLYLATGTDLRLADRVAAHLGIFSGVLSSDGVTNLIGSRKLDRLCSCLGSGAFDYVGNDTPDLPLLAHATEAMVANSSLGLRIRLRARGIRPTRTFEEGRNSPLSMLKAMRTHQWAKNLLVFVPLLLAHGLTMAKLLPALVGFFCFSLAASATYIVNDLLDIEADRHHPRKRLRPFASGDLSAFTGLGMVTALTVLALTGGWFLGPAFNGWLLLYIASTLTYSVYLKRIALVDVLVLSGLYTLRLLAGSATTQTRISHWLAGFSVFLFLSLAFVKRFAELENLRASAAAPKNGRGYLVTDLEQLRNFGTASAFAAIVIFANYISSRDVEALYHKPSLLWLIVPLMTLWLCRVWLLASRGEMNEDPVVFAIADKMSLVVGAAVTLIAVLAL